MRYFPKSELLEWKTSLLLKIDCTLNAVFYSLASYVAVNVKYCFIIKIMEYGVIMFWRQLGLLLVRLVILIFFASSDHHWATSAGALPVLLCHICNNHWRNFKACTWDQRLETFQLPVFQTQSRVWNKHRLRNSTEVPFLAKRTPGEISKVLNYASDINIKHKLRIFWQPTWLILLLGTR